jgi:hypothetical protein
VRQEVILVKYRGAHLDCGYRLADDLQYHGTSTRDTLFGKQLDGIVASAVSVIFAVNEYRFRLSPCPGGTFLPPENSP